VVVPKVVPKEIGPGVEVEAPNLIDVDAGAWKVSDFSRLGCAAGVAAIGLSVGFFAPGRGVIQQAHLSLVSALETRHVSQVHF